MTNFFTGVLTVLLVLDCLLLILLVLVQLPKKEAGAGLAFGGAATDALFGAGSGNVLTKITKWAAGIFFLLAMFLAVLQKSGSGPGRDIERRMEQQGRPVAGAPSAPSAGTPKASSGTNVPVVPAPAIPVPGGTNTEIALPPAPPK